MSPSYHHAYVCSKLSAAFNNLEHYTAFSELTLQIQGKDISPTSYFTRSGLLISPAKTLLK